MYDSPKVPESFLWPSAAKMLHTFFFLNKLIMCLKHVVFLSEVWGSENKIVLYHRCQCMFKKCLKNKMSLFPEYFPGFHLFLKRDGVFKQV